MVMKSLHCMAAKSLWFVLSFAAVSAFAVDLPANYTRLDWIESDATNQQWIDSGYSPNTATIINVSLLARSPKDAWAVFFGVIEGSTSATSVRFRYDGNSHLQGLFGNSNASEGQIDSVKDGEYQIELKSGCFTITRAGSDPVSKQLTSGTTIVNAPMYIFCQNEYTSATGKSAPSRYQPMRLYSMAIREGDTPKRDFIPCMDDKGICGLWDNVEGKFYTNKGTGAGFTGGVTVAAGATLAIPASKNILTESEIDAMTSKIARFDPDCEAVIDFNNDKTMVHAVFDHGKKEVDGTPYIHATYAIGGDRRPTYSRQARGYGPVRGWMDLHADSDSGTKKGNNLRVKTDHSLKHGNDSGSVPLGVKTAFIVMDSCYGGGLPIIDAINPGNIVKARTYSDFTSPIWGSGTSSILTGGETRLNGIAVNGTTTGFTGAPELFSFTTDGHEFNAAFFGYYNAGGDQAYEVLGEIVLFSEVLDSDKRGGVEAYLMKKWLGTLPPGYADWTGATVTGAGTVKAECPKDLPQFDNFTGTLEFTASTLAFTIDCVNGTVAEAFDIGSATLKLADEGVFNLSFKDGIVQPGTYILGSFGTVDGAGVSGWAVTPEYTADDRYRIKVVATTDAELVAKVMPFGMLFIVR